MGQIIGRGDNFRLVRKSQRVRVAGVRPRIDFPRPLVKYDANKRSVPVFNRSGEYNYPVRDVQDGLTPDERFRGVLDTLEASAVSSTPPVYDPTPPSEGDDHSTGVPDSPDPETPGPEPEFEDLPESDDCKKIQFGAEDSVIWHDKMGRHHLIYGKYITETISPAQYKIRLIEQNSAVTHTSKEFTIKVNAVQASPQNPVRVLYYNRVDSSNKGKQFDEERAIPLFYICGKAQTTSTPPESEGNTPEEDDASTRQAIKNQALAAGQQAFKNALANGQTGKQARAAFDSAKQAAEDAGADDPANERQDTPEEVQTPEEFLVAEVFKHSFFPEVDADNDPDVVDLILWMNEICDPAKNEEQVDEPEGPINGPITPGGDNSSSGKSEKGVSSDRKTDATGDSKVEDTAQDQTAAGCDSSVPGDSFVPMGEYPTGRVDVLRGCKRKLVHCEGQHVHLISNAGQLNSIFMFRKPYTVIECDDGPISPLINGDRIFVDDRPEGSKGNKSTLVYNEEGKKGDTDDLFVIAKFLTANLGQQIDDLQNQQQQKQAEIDFLKQQFNASSKGGASQAQLDAQQAKIDTAEGELTDINDQLTQLLRANDQHRLMLRMECAPDPRGGMITNKEYVGMLRDPFILMQDFLELKTQVFFRQVENPLQCKNGGVTGPILFTEQQAPPCIEGQEESGEMDGPVKGLEGA